MERRDPVLSQVAYLMVVQRGDFDRFRFLSATFRDKSIQVMWDRRQRERRGATGLSGHDRRISDRRADPPVSWSNLGFLVTRQGGPATDPGDAGSAGG
jgi:hypothetical protein